MEFQDDFRKRLFQREQIQQLFLQRGQREAFQVHVGSERRHDIVIGKHRPDAGPLVLASNAFEQQGIDIHIDQDQFIFVVFGGRKMEIAVLPQKEIIDDLFRPRDQRFFDILLGHKIFLNENFPKHDPGLQVDFKGSLQLRFGDFSLKQQELPELFGRIIRSGGDDLAVFQEKMNLRFFLDEGE